jgi:hypothetical protein
MLVTKVTAGTVEQIFDTELERFVSQLFNPDMWNGKPAYFGMMPNGINEPVDSSITQTLQRGDITVEPHISYDMIQPPDEPQPNEDQYALQLALMVVIDAAKATLAEEYRPDAPIDLIIKMLEQKRVLPKIFPHSTEDDFPFEPQGTSNAERVSQRIDDLDLFVDYDDLRDK